MGYDVIVVGARVAGAATAMLLARRGLKVLAVDRVSFPSDTISSHQVQLPGVALLHRWGLLDRVRASGAPPTRDVRFDTPEVVLRGRFPEHVGVDALYSPRRTVLDGILVDAARAAGAEVRENFRVEELMWSDGRVAGVRSGSIVESARLVVGADGKHSMVARAVGAACYRVRRARSFASYTYWAGLPVAEGAIYQRPQRTVAVFPTNDDLTMVYVAAPLAGFDSYRKDIEGHYLKTLDLCGDLGERVAGARRAERIRTTPDQPNMFRRSHGQGWALVGDAGVVMDSISAQGISNALRDADLLAAAIAEGLGGARPLGAALARHQRLRDRGLTAMYDLTTRLTRFQPRLAETALLAALRDRPHEISRFLGVIAGAEPPDRFFGPVNALRLIGARGLARLARVGVEQALRCREAYSA